MTQRQQQQRRQRQQQQRFLKSQTQAAMRRLRALWQLMRQVRRSIDMLPFCWRLHGDHKPCLIAASRPILHPLLLVCSAVLCHLCFGMICFLGRTVLAQGSFLLVRVSISAAEYLKQGQKQYGLLMCCTAWLVCSVPASAGHIT